MRYDTLYPEDDFKRILRGLQKKSPVDIATDLRKTYEDLLSLIGCALFKIARQYVRNQAFDFYFWPGYESIYLKRGAHTRVTLLLDSRDERMQCGVGFNLLDSQTEPVIYHVNRSVLWFDRVLSPQGDHDFTPGSTHKWLVQDGLSLSDGSRLQILDVSTSAQPLSSEQKGRTLSVRLDSCKSTEYGEQMSIILNSPDVIGTQRRWPHSEQVCNEEHNHLREKLYDIWLGATLGPPNEPPQAKWLATVAGECVRNGATHIATAIVSPEQLPPDAQEHHYRHWYSIAIDPTFGASQDLGTAMLLTSCDLPAECLMHCQNAVRLMYLEWRDLEEHLLKVPACDPFVCELSASEWNRLRQAMWKTCERLGCNSRSSGDPFWAHHLPGGGPSPWINPPEHALIAPWTDQLVTAAAENLTMASRQQGRDIQRLVLDWPPHEWTVVGASGFEECFCWMPPIRALAQFDEEAEDLTKLFERLQTAAEKLKNIECRLLFDDIKHNYLWFNAPALAHCLFIFIRGLSSDISNKNKEYVFDKQNCTGATVRWEFFERQDDDSISFIVRVQQILRYPKRDKALLLPQRDSATKKILAAYQRLESIGARLNIVSNALEIAIGPGRLSRRYGRNTVDF